VPPTLKRRLDPRIGIAVEALGKSPAGGGLHRRSGPGLPTWRRHSQRLPARQITLLQALLALEQAVLCLQQQPLRTLRPQTVRLSRLQLLHSLLQPINARLALHGLPRKAVALPFLRGLLELLLTLLTLKLSLFRLQQPLLRALSARTFGLLRFQFLHALL
jgi:hypothetical protein